MNDRFEEFRQLRLEAMRLCVDISRDIENQKIGVDLGTDYDCNLNRNMGNIFLSFKTEIAASISAFAENETETILESFVNNLHPDDIYDEIGITFSNFKEIYLFQFEDLETGITELKELHYQDRDRIYKKMEEILLEKINDSEDLKIADYMELRELDLTV